MENKSTRTPASAHEWPWLNTSLPPDERSALLLAQMTREDISRPFPGSAYQR